MLSDVVALVAPGARLVGSSTFSGGISSEMALVEVEDHDGARQRFVVRRAKGERGSIPMAVEFQLLQAASARGLAVPTPRLFDDSGRVSEQPYMVLDYVDGVTDLSSDDGIEKAHSLADTLAAIHAVDGGDPVFAALPERTATVTQVLRRRAGVALDDSIGEGRILDALHRHWPPRPPAGRSLLHCDLWLGNVLWSEGQVVAVIDWENAHVGDPLADLSITRLEMAWTFGRDAVTALTERYAEGAGIDLGALPVWDLAAARRVAGEVSRWADDWVNYGQPDMTTARMRAAHEWFVDDALAALDAGES
jgi:aminoglycoside phosphotransferase (APT) family kinase protein